jgi:hypothetical protein
MVDLCGPRGRPRGRLAGASIVVAGASVENNPPSSIGPCSMPSRRS